MASQNFWAHACTGCQLRWSTAKQASEHIRPGSAGEGQENPIWGLCGECRRAKERADAEIAEIRRQVADLAASVKVLAVAGGPGQAGATAGTADSAGRVGGTFHSALRTYESPHVLIPVDSEREVNAIYMRFRTKVCQWTLSSSGVEIVVCQTDTFRDLFVVDVAGLTMPTWHPSRRFRELYLTVPCANEITIDVVYAAGRGGERGRGDERA